MKFLADFPRNHQLAIPLECQSSIVIHSPPRVFPQNRACPGLNQRGVAGQQGKPETYPHGLHLKFSTLIPTTKTSPTP